MTQEEKQVIANEIDKYFKSISVNHQWLSSHIRLDIEMPDDGFESEKMSGIKINEDSISQIGSDKFVFRGEGKVLFIEKVSKVGTKAEVEFKGIAFTVIINGRLLVTDVILTSFHRITDLLPHN